MKKILLLICLSAASLQAAPPGQPLFEENQNLEVNNRVLLKINGKPITVLDVARKMDMIFYRQYPELSSSSTARYQFYSSAWEPMLTALIDDLLIMADAEEKGVTISEGEIREELESLFGPDVVFNIDKLGMTLDEAVEQLKMELTVQRMNMMMVRSKAIAESHPKEVRHRYEKMIQENPPKDRWVYRVLSVRGQEHKRVAQEAFKLLNEQKLPFEEVVETLSTPEVEIALSEDYEREEGALSLAHKAVLQTLSAGAFSAPLCKESVSRIFFLGEFKNGSPTPFNDIAEQLKQELTQEIAEKHNEAYKLKLRKHYGITERYLKQVMPESFQPFALR